MAGSVPPNVGGPRPGHRQGIEMLNEDGERWRHLKYVSLRLAKKYLDLMEATAPDSSGPKVELDFTVPGALGGLGISLGSPERPPTGNNAVAIARALDEGLRGTYVDFATTTDPRDVTTQSLVKATLLFQPAHLQIQNYDLVHPMRNPYYVYATTSIDRVPGIGRVFVGLVGSEHNLLSLPGDGTIGAGHTASDAEGLYEMIQFTKEQAYGEDLSQRALDHDLPPYREATAENRLKTVASAFLGYALQSVPRPTEALFEVHHVARDIDLEVLGPHTDGGGHVDLALFGAPIWVREATDRDLLSANDLQIGVGGLDELWDTLDSELRHHIRDEKFETQWRPSSEDELIHFTQWATAWAKRVGPEPKGLTWRRRRKILGLFLGSDEDAVDAGLDGWLAHGWGEWRGYLMGTDARLYPVSTPYDDPREAWSTTLANTPALEFAGEGRPRPVAWDDSEVADVVSTVLLTITGWLLPFADRRAARRRY